jgi:REP element-mobilizing transposase RayT
MKKLAEERPELKDYIIYCGSYDGQVGFYTRFWNEKKGYDIKVAEYWKEDIMQQGTYVLSCYREKLEKVKEEYKTETISTYEKCQVLHLLEVR